MCIESTTSIPMDALFILIYPHPSIQLGPPSVQKKIYKLTSFPWEIWTSGKNLKTKTDV